MYFQLKETLTVKDSEPAKNSNAAKPPSSTAEPKDGMLHTHLYSCSVFSILFWKVIALYMCKSVLHDPPSPLIVHHNYCTSTPRETLNK